MSDTDDQKQAAARLDYQNEPHTDFSRAENRKAFAQALKDVEEQLGREYPIVIDGKASQLAQIGVSLNPSHKSQTVGTVMAATVITQSRR
ncbi:MAG: hypothetical protein R3B91_13700 [Planctomycetaceae bacterium]